MSKSFEQAYNDGTYDEWRTKEPDEACELETKCSSCNEWYPDTEINGGICKWCELDDEEIDLIIKEKNNGTNEIL